MDDTSYMKELPDWQLIPTTFDGICDSVEVAAAGTDSSGAHRHQLVYKNKPSEDSTEDALYEVCLRVQGSVKYSKIGPLGDWNGYVIVYLMKPTLHFCRTAASCPRASHKMILEGSLDEDTFVLQTQAIDQMKDYIHKCLTSKAPPTRSAASYGTGDTLMLQRRVFTRVRL